MKIVIADSKEGKCYQTEIDATKSKPLYGAKIGEEIEGSLIGLTGYKLQVTGGTDKDGFPMRKDVQGTERKSIVISSGSGIRKNVKGERKKKTVRGNTISDQVAQINIKVTNYGSKSISETIGIKKPAEQEEKPAETKGEKK